jgi:hypothetical protein
LGIIRILGTFGFFELIKPELRKFSPAQRKQVKKSFYGYRHWLTMTRELWNLYSSGRQVAIANNFNGVTLIDIQSKSFFKPSIFTFLLPLKGEIIFS